MKALVTCEESKALDAATTEALALSALQLMEKASLRLWDAIRTCIAGRDEIAAKGKAVRIVALCGKGDNGGDAMAILRHAFSSGFQDLQAILSARELSESAKKQVNSLGSAGVRCAIWKGADDEGIMSMLSEADIILDGILGTGLAGAAGGEAKAMIDSIGSIQTAKARPLVISIDLPSGLGDSWEEGFPCVRADITLCLEPAKTACYLPLARRCCGELVLVGDVFPESLVNIRRDTSLIEARDIVPDPISAESYKMSRGRLAIFAGSRGAIGAAQLCAKAAAASGAGYVTLYVDESAYAILARSLDSIIVKPLGDLRDIGSNDAILIGPGWGNGEGRDVLLRELLEAGVPAVLDADALRLLAARPELAASIRAPCALTPHPGELAALALCASAIQRAIPAETSQAVSIAHVNGAAIGLREMRRTCEYYKSLLVAKSHVTWIVSPKRVAVWDGMTPELGTAGSGDVLAGLLAGLIAGKTARLRKADSSKTLAEKSSWKALEDAAIVAVAAHGTAGKRMAKEKGWFEASDLIAECSLLLHSGTKRVDRSPPLTQSPSTR